MRLRAEDPWLSLFDGAAAGDAPRRTSVEGGGASPGVKSREVMLHHRDAITVQPLPFRHFRLDIRRPARGWGVSVWQIDIEGDELPDA